MAPKVRRSRGKNYYLTQHLTWHGRTSEHTHRHTDRDREIENLNPNLHWC